MTKKTELSSNTSSLPDFLVQRNEEAQTDVGSNEKYRNLTVYNKNTSKGEKLDKEKAGKMYIGKHVDGEEYEETNGTILLVRKAFIGFKPNDFGKYDIYWTNYLGVFDKGPVILKSMVHIDDEGNKKTETKVFQTIVEFREAINKEGSEYFKEMKTPMSGGDPYKVSYIQLQYSLFFQDSNGEIFEVNPKSSYGNFKNVNPGTIEALRDAGKAKLKEAGASARNAELSMFNVSLKCKHDQENNVFKFDWTLNGFISEDNAEAVAEVRDYIDEINSKMLEDNTEKEATAIEAPKTATVKEIEAKVEETTSTGQKKSDLPF